MQKKKKTVTPSSKAASKSTRAEKPAYLIVEKIDGEVHVYMESANHYENAKQWRYDSIELSPEVLGHECNLAAYGDNVHFVFKLA